MSLGKDQSIIQDAESFSKFANQICKSLQVHNILKMFVKMADGKNLYLW